MYGTAQNLVLIEFKDKANIEANNIDMPISKSYIQQVENLGFTFKNASNWLNIGVFSYTDASILKHLNNLSFIKKTTYDCHNDDAINRKKIVPSQNKFIIENNSNTQKTKGTSAFYLPQILQVGGDYLQDLGFKGNGIKIAVIDAGFPNANTLGGLQHIYQSNRLLGTYDFYQNDSNVYANNSHGTNTFSIIGGLKSDFSGAAPDASFYLFRTEVDAFEGQTEEVFLAEALERSNQLGVKIASISLGYENNGGSGFNDGTQDHTLTEMDGHTTISAKAVNIATNKGMLVCVAAGNEGGSAWKYLVTPADADSGFTIGAVDVDGIAASFSCYNFDTSIRIKPNVVGMGLSTSFISQNNSVNIGNGTSYACPLIAGLSACLWQAFPNKTNWEIKTAIEQSASKYLTPDKHIGYGIPDFRKAYQQLSLASSVSNHKLENEFSIFPNPFQNKININNLGNSNVEQIKLINNLGQVIYSANTPTTNNFTLDNLQKGMYILQISTNKGQIVKKLFKD